MFKQGAWRKHPVIFFYAIAVFMVEYVVIQHHLSASVYEREALEMSPTWNTLNSSDSSLATKSAVPGDVAMNARHLASNMTFMNSYLSGVNSSQVDLQEVASSTWDKAKLHIVQMRISNCVQQKGEMLRCLEEEYIRERHEMIHEMIHDLANNPGDKPNASNNHDRVVHRKKPPKKPAPTDDPVKFEQYFKRRENKTNPFIYDYVLSPKRTCDNDTYMIVLVHSFHPYIDRRTAIRTTWGGAAKGSLPWPNSSYIQRKVKFIFMLGTHTNNVLNANIANESILYDDIIQGNFTDAYVNMTLKSLLGLKYVSEHCPHAQYLLKSDDDMFINMPYLLDILGQNTFSRTIMGPLNRGSKVYRSGKWKVRPEDFPFHYYPQYESGSAYVITNDIVRELYETAEYVPQFHVDDAYITGVVGKVIQVNHDVRPGFAFWTDKPPIPCDIYLNKKISGTKMTPTKIRHMWSELASRPKC